MKADFKKLTMVIRADLYRYDGASGLRGFFKNYVKEPGFRYSCWMRMVGFASQHKILKGLYYLACYQRHRLELKLGISIPPMTRIGPGLFIGHVGGIVVNGLAVIGRNCNLSHGVTIGQKNRGKFKGCPRIGDSVYIGPGVAILGSVVVGSNVAIGANAVVVDNVGDNEVVVGNPARRISTQGSTDYVNWTLDA
jgi:serine O-acetyltransferase